MRLFTKAVQFQKIQCTFKTDIPDLGYLDGGSDRDVSSLQNLTLHHCLIRMATDQSLKQDAATILASDNAPLLVRKNSQYKTRMIGVH
jgi:hypothetical protein